MIAQVEYKDRKENKEKVGRSNLTRYMHRARLGKLTLDGLQRGLREPEWVREIAEDLEEFVE